MGNEYTGNTLQQFKTEVAVRFQLYNSLFTSLPFHKIEKTGILLSLLSSLCEDGYAQGESPVHIIDNFFARHTNYASEKEQLNLLFSFVQYAERQVVLFDALEDAAFTATHDMNGTGTLRHLFSELQRTQQQQALTDLLKIFSVRLVLTAHPTQFYPGSVLGIINDLAKALAANNTSMVNELLQQLGRTPFFKKIKPTPYDEAISLIWYLENVFYLAGSKIQNTIKANFPAAIHAAHPILQMGFWPGSDRDGNPFVQVDTTLKVADALRSSILKCYYLDIRKLRRRLTFDGIEPLLTDLEAKVYTNLFIPGQKTVLTKAELIVTLENIKSIILKQHNGLFVHLVESLIHKIQLFGLHFASLDIRQHSSIHTQIIATLANNNVVLHQHYLHLGEAEKIEALLQVQCKIPSAIFTDPVQADTIKAIAAIKTIQQYNGKEGCSRYVISQCHSALHIIEVLTLFRLAGWESHDLPIDIVPLFENIDDLKKAAATMETIYSIAAYKNHLRQRGDTQTIMLGFSDGTKDGGYLMGNWAIYKAKEELTAISQKFGIHVVFFDGRGGPPSRGGGKTHRFYASMGKNIANREIQLTIQGQTVSSTYGTVDAAGYNIEQLINAGISNALFSENETTLTPKEESLLQIMAEKSYETYRQLRDHPDLIDYLVHASPLRFYGDTNIGSRPTKRGNAGVITLQDLRAIPYAGSWSQLKQNVTGFYGVGTALQIVEKNGNWHELLVMYQQSLFFKTLLDNCEMSMSKSNFSLTKYLSIHPKFGKLWQLIYEEYELTKKYILRLSGRKELMDDHAVDKLSIQMREKIVLPLVSIQQYALNRIREMEEKEPNATVLTTCEKLAMRCSFGIINAGRNSA